jgi:hypothetical protein
MIKHRTGRKHANQEGTERIMYSVVTRLVAKMHPGNCIEELLRKSIFLLMGSSSCCCLPCRQVTRLNLNDTELCLDSI